MTPGSELDLILATPRMGHVPWAGENSAKGLYDLVRLNFKPDFEIAEVGSFQGVSTLLFSMFVKKVYAIDCFDYIVPNQGRLPEMDELFVNAEKVFDQRTKDIKNIVKIRKTSLEAAKDFKDYSLDAVYIDAEHDYASVKSDIRTWKWKVKDGGIISGHDYHLPHIANILAEEELVNELTVYPDTSWSVRVRRLPTIGLVAVACTKVGETIEAIQKSLKQKSFDSVQLFTHEKINPLGIEVVNIPKLDYKQYNEFVAMNLWEKTRTDYVILVQNDGYILDGTKWSDDFLSYDYIGAPWPPQTHFTKSGEEIRVGNGGFSLRSRKLLMAPTELGLEFTDHGTGFWHEDGFLCVHFRKELEAAGVVFAPTEVAAQFSTELTVPETTTSFGGHRYI